jgi:hypothetical protein
VVRLTPVTEKTLAIVEARLVRAFPATKEGAKSGWIKACKRREIMMGLKCSERTRNNISLLGSDTLTSRIDDIDQITDSETS